MARELRRIMFDTQEVIDAIVGFSNEIGERAIDRTKVKSINVISVPKLKTSIRMDDDHQHCFGECSLAQALIWWCISKQVPLPIGASKAATVIDGQVVLEVRLD